MKDIEEVVFESDHRAIPGGVEVFLKEGHVLFPCRKHEVGALSEERETVEREEVGTVAQDAGKRDDVSEGMSSGS